MKLSQLTPEHKARLLAELDGWTWLNVDNSNRSVPLREWKRGKEYCADEDLCYDIYDAIIPLVQKLDDALKSNIECMLYDELNNLLDATPSQLCDAVLIATGKAEL